jgi:DNA-directed RNA polymerase alpha subunit
MNVTIQNPVEKDNILTFTLRGVNVSLANALRRIILSDIPLVVFKTSPYEKNKANIMTNTSRLNNEILKQRLSCIPIYIKDLTIPLQNYLLEVEMENTTDTTIFVTTEHFKIKNLVTGDYLSEKDTRAIFPANDQTGYFIDFVRLRPRISDELPGEKIHLTCELSISNAKDDGMFNSVSTCSYGYSVDDVKMEDELKKKRQEWRDQGLNEKEIQNEVENWKLLDGKRITVKDSFDFIVQTVGVYSNQEIVHKACDILSEKFVELNTLFETDQVEIRESNTTMVNCYDVIIQNEDYTIGKVLEYFLYTLFFEEVKILTYCGFKKLHPHDNYSIIRLAYKDNVDKSTVKQNFTVCIEEALKVYKKMKKDI